MDNTNSLIIQTDDTSSYDPFYTNTNIYHTNSNIDYWNLSNNITDDVSVYYRYYNIISDKLNLNSENIKYDQVKNFIWINFNSHQINIQFIIGTKMDLKISALVIGYDFSKPDNIYIFTKKAIP